jgi:hypothetical protein
MKLATGTSLGIIAFNSAAGFAAHLGEVRDMLPLAAAFTIAALLGLWGGLNLAGRVPDRDNPDLPTVLCLGREYSASPNAKRLFEAISLHHTNRHPFVERELSATLKAELQSEAEREQLLLIEDVKARLAIIKLIARSSLAQRRDLRW